MKTFILVGLFLTSSFCWADVAVYNSPSENVSRTKVRHLDLILSLTQDTIDSMVTILKSDKPFNEELTIDSFKGHTGSEKHPLMLNYYKGKRIVCSNADQKCIVSLDTMDTDARGSIIQIPLKLEDLQALSAMAKEPYSFVYKPEGWIESVMEFLSPTRTKKTKEISNLSFQCFQDDFDLVDVWMACGAKLKLKIEDTISQTSSRLVSLANAKNLASDERERGKAVNNGGNDLGASESNLSSEVAPN